MNQIITIKEIKGFPRVRAKVGSGVGGGDGRPAQEVTPAETWMSGRPERRRGGCPTPGGRRAQPGPPEARRARGFVCQVLAEASPTPSAVLPGTPSNLSVSPALSPRGPRPRPSRGPHLTPPAPAPYPLRGRGQRQPRHVVAEQHRIGRESRGRIRWKRRHPAREQRGPARPAPGARRTPAAGPAASPPVTGRARSHAAAREGGRRAGREGARAGARARRLCSAGARESTPTFSLGGTPTSRPREEGRP